MNDQYENHKALISGLASNYSRKTGLEYDEFIGVANLAFTKAQQSFNDKYTFSTWLYLCIKNAIINHISSEYKQKNLENKLRSRTELELNYIVDDQGNQIFLPKKEYVPDLETTPDIEKIIEIAIEVNKSINNSYRQPSVFAIEKILKKIEWSEERIRSSFSRIKAALCG